MAKTSPDRVSIGKFEILATYTYARALLDGLPENAAKERGLLAAVMGAQARTGTRRRRDQEHPDRTPAAKSKSESTITAAAFDRQVRDKLGPFFDAVFLPALTRLVQAGLSYEEVKDAVAIPARWGAKINGAQFRERAARAVERT